MAYFYYSCFWKNPRFFVNTFLYFNGIFFFFAQLTLRLLKVFPARPNEILKGPYEKDWMGGARGVERKKELKSCNYVRKGQRSARRISIDWTGTKTKPIGVKKEIKKENKYKAEKENTRKRKMEGKKEYRYKL